MNRSNLAGISRSTPGRSDTGRHETGHSESGRSESGRSESGRARAGRSGGSRSGSSQASQTGAFEQFGRAVLFAVAALGIAHATSLILMSAYRHSFWSQQSVSTVQRIAALRTEVRELEDRAARARSDREYLEQLARRQGFVRPSERVIVPVAPGAGLPVEDAAPIVPLSPSGSGR
jgi:cell division protein FtsB